MKKLLLSTMLLLSTQAQSQITCDDYNEGVERYGVSSISMLTLDNNTEKRSLVPSIKFTSPFDRYFKWRDEDFRIYDLTEENDVIVFYTEKQKRKHVRLGYQVILTKTDDGIYDLEMATATQADDDWNTIFDRKIDFSLEGDLKQEMKVNQASKEKKEAFECLK